MFFTCSHEHAVVTTEAEIIPRIGQANTIDCTARRCIDLGACVAISALHWTLLPCTRILGATIIASGKQRLFQLRPTSSNTKFGEPLSTRGGLGLPLRRYSSIRG